MTKNRVPRLTVLRDAEGNDYPEDVQEAHRKSVTFWLAQQGAGHTEIVKDLEDHVGRLQGVANSDRAVIKGTAWVCQQALVKLMDDVIALVGAYEPPSYPNNGTEVRERIVALLRLHKVVVEASSSVEPPEELEQLRAQLDAANEQLQAHQVKGDYEAGYAMGVLAGIQHSIKVVEEIKARFDRYPPILDGVLHELRTLEAKAKADVG